MKTWIPLESLNPSVRYVNHICFSEQSTVAKRILFDHEFLYCLSGEGPHGISKPRVLPSVREICSIWSPSWIIEW